MESVGALHVSRIVDFAVTPPKYKHDRLEWVTLSGTAECFTLNWKPLSGHTIHVVSKQFDWGSCITDSQGRFSVSDRLPGFDGTYQFQAVFQGTWNIRPCASSTISVVVEGPVAPPPSNGGENGNGYPPPPSPPPPPWPYSVDMKSILLYGGIGVTVLLVVVAISRR